MTPSKATFDGQRNLKKNKFLLFPVKIHWKCDTKLVLLFFSKKAQLRFYTNVLTEQGFTSPLEQYAIKGELNSERSSTFISAKHKCVEKKVAIKVIFRDVHQDVVDLNQVPFIALLEQMRQGKYPKNVVKHLELIEEDQYIYFISAL